MSNSEHRKRGSGASQRDCRQPRRDTRAPLSEHVSHLHRSASRGFASGCSGGSGGEGGWGVENGFTDRFERALEEKWLKFRTWQNQKVPLVERSGLRRAHCVAQDLCSRGARFDATSTTSTTSTSNNAQRRSAKHKSWWSHRLGPVISWIQITSDSNSFAIQSPKLFH